MNKGKVDPERLTLVKIVPFWLLIIFLLMLILVLPQCSTYKNYAPTDVKSNLRNLYIACNAYWADKGNDKNCTVDIASQDTYGYIQSSDVAVSGNGTATTFVARGHHVKSYKSYIMNTTGDIIRDK